MDDQLCKIILRRIQDGVFAVDNDCRITLFNPAAARITGYDTSEAVGRLCYEVFHGSVRRELCAIRETLDDQIPVNDFRETYLKKSGEVIPVRVSTMLLTSSEGEILGAVGVFRDETAIMHRRQLIDRQRVFGRIKTANHLMHTLLNQLPDVARSDCSVLIEGPSGSGKELFAQAVHDLSPRRAGPYIRLNCAALPATLLESEMFGYEKGAFTDARRKKPGMFSLANGGTLLLDEIGNMDPALQVKLLRVLNDGEYTPLGATTTLRTDARIIASTNEDLVHRIEKGFFRADLYYRINVVRIEIPPLRDRLDDIPLLINHFLQKKRRATHNSVRNIDPEVYAILKNYSFPGNVRELENIIEHALVMCHDDCIQPSHLPHHILEESQAHPPVAAKNERELILSTLEQCEWNRTEAAQRLGMHRTTLWRKLKQIEAVSEAQTT